jgi:PEP-CTERM motif-containing protein
MYSMVRRRHLFYATACAFFAEAMWCSLQAGPISIPTNFGIGADAEVREDADNHMRPNTDPLWGPPGTPRGRNRGGLNGSQLFGGDLQIDQAGGMELATRAVDHTNAPANDRTSAMYLKFDISGITQAQLDSRHTASLRLTVRNANNLAWSRLYEMKPYYGTLPADNTNPDFVAYRADINNWQRARFKVQGLKPEGMAAADPRRFGNVDPNLAVPNYDWIEQPSANGDPAPEFGTNVVEPQSLDETTWDPVQSPLIGPKGPITWYNAPGITPDSRTTPLQDPGKYNFNSDLEELGSMFFPDPPAPGPTTPNGGARLPVGQDIIYNGGAELHDLIQRAKDAGRSSITLVVSFANDTLQNITGETLQTTPNNFLNFNYLVNPKEQDSRNAILTPATPDPGLQLADDPGWDPDGSGAGVATGSPFSCDGLAPAPNSANCPGHSIGNNDNGRYSPTLLLHIPEPGSVVLLAIGLFSSLAIRRRK